MSTPGVIRVPSDPMGDKLDELADIAEYWKRHRSRGYVPMAIRAALLMLCDEIACLQDQASLLAEGETS